MKLWKMIIYIYVIVQAQAVFATEKIVQDDITAEVGPAKTSIQNEISFLDGVPTERSVRPHTNAMFQDDED